MDGAEERYEITGKSKSLLLFFSYLIKLNKAMPGHVQSSDFLWESKHSTKKVCGPRLNERHNQPQVNTL